MSRIWAFLGVRPGDNAQVMALARELGQPFDEKILSYNILHLLTGRFMGASRISLERRCREEVVIPPWPDLIIAVGRRAVPIARWVRKQNGGRTKLVLIGHPRVNPSKLDLVFTTRQYPIPEAPSVHLLPVAMSPYRSPPARTEEENSWLQRLPRPHLLMALGGKTRYWRLPPEHLADAAEILARRADSRGGTLIVIGSARTDPAGLAAIEERLDGAGPHQVLWQSRPRFAVLMDDADEIFPTADSVSMLSEAVITGKPVGMVPVVMNRLSGWLIGTGQEARKRNRRRDLRRFWNFLLAAGLIGSIEAPVASALSNPVVEASQEVAALLDEGP